MSKTLILVLSGVFFCASQEIVNKNNSRTFLFSLNHSLQVPAGDLSKRFGNSSNISSSLMYKTNKDMFLSFEFGFNFGSNVKENNIFESIDGNNGYLISQNGEIPTIRLFQRGGTADISVGKFLKFNSKKNYCGFLMLFGVGYIYHKIFIETLTVQLPQLDDELIKGYDRLSGGPMAKQFLGYLHVSKKNNIRFKIGLETIQGFTKSLRRYNYNSQSFDNEKRHDLIFGIKTGFVIPISQRTSEKYYIY